MRQGERKIKKEQYRGYFYAYRGYFYAYIGYFYAYRKYSVSSYTSLKPDRVVNVK